MNAENLVRNEDRTPAQRRANARKAGLASAKARAERKTLSNLLKAALEMKDDNGLTNSQRITVALIEKALKGDTKAYEIIRDTIGEKPEENINLNAVEVNIFDES